jgi:hypothetical protein
MKKTRALSCALAAGFGVAALALLPGTSAATAAETSAAAAETCAVKADLPSQIAIDREDVQVNVHLSGCEGGLDWAAASVYGADGTIGTLYWDSDGNRGQYLDVWSLTTPGTYRTVSGNGEALTANSVTWTYDRTVIKYKTRAHLATSRSGHRVTFSGHATRYQPYVGYVNTVKRYVSIQVRSSATAPWHTIRHLRTDSSGRVRWTHSTVHVWDYRMVVWSSHSSFPAVSNTVHR